LQHLVVIGIDRDVGVHVAIARVHMQRDPDSAPQDLLVDLLDRFQYRQERTACE
jgi:hypothetical protein